MMIYYRESNHTSWSTRGFGKLHLTCTEKFLLFVRCHENVGLVRFDVHGRFGSFIFSFTLIFLSVSNLQELRTIKLKLKKQLCTKKMFISKPLIPAHVFQTRWIYNMIQKTTPSSEIINLGRDFSPGKKKER